MKEKKNKKYKKSNNINFNYSEEFITNIENTTKENLKDIFNKKYFNYINRLENRSLGECINE